MKNGKHKVTEPEEISQAEISEEPKVDDYKEKYLRALADYQNLEKQTDSWKREFVQYANIGLIDKLLEILDDLEKTQEHLNNEGLQIVINKLKTVLGEEGLEQLDLQGQEYDPRLAEVVSTEVGETDNIITKVLQKGYRIKDKIIRPAKVIVSTKN